MQPMAGQADDRDQAAEDGRPGLAGGESGITGPRQARAAVQRVEVGEQLQQPRLRRVLVDQDRGARPGVAQVAGVGLARAEVGLVDPGAGVPVAVAAVAGAADVGQRLVGVGEDDLLSPPRPSRGCERPGRRPRARARRGRCARPRSAPGRAAARRPGRRAAARAPGARPRRGRRRRSAPRWAAARHRRRRRCRGRAAPPPGAWRRAPAAPSAEAKRPARCAARKTFCWAWVPCGIWAAM